MERVYYVLMFSLIKKWPIWGKKPRDTFCFHRRRVRHLVPLATKADGIQRKNGSLKNGGERRNEHAALHYSLNIMPIVLAPFPRLIFSDLFTIFENREIQMSGKWKLIT